MRWAGIPAYGVQRANFQQKLKMTNFQYFCIFMYIWWILTFLGFCVWKAYKWYTGVYLRIFDPGPSNPTTFLGLCSPIDYRQSMGVPTFNSTEKALTFTIYDCILRIRPKRCFLTKVSPLDVELFSMRHLLKTLCRLPAYSVQRAKDRFFFQIVNKRWQTCPMYYCCRLVNPCNGEAHCSSALLKVPGTKTNHLVEAATSWKALFFFAIICFNQ